MPKMSDSRRKKIQAKQRRTRAAELRERKAARRRQRAGKGTAGVSGSPKAETAAR